MKRILSVLALWLVVLLPLTSQGAPNVTGQRIGLCGFLRVSENATILESPGLPSIKLLGLRPGSPGEGLCVVGPELPAQKNGVGEFLVTKAEFSPLVKELLGRWVSPHKVCGQPVKDGDQIYLQYGAEAEQRVYLRKNTLTEDLYRYMENGLPDTLCAYSRALSTKRADGRWEIDTWAY